MKGQKKMKKSFLVFTIFAVLFAFAAPAQAQFYALSKSMAVSKAYANSQADTSAVIAGIGSYNNVGVVFKAVDSVSLKIYIDIRPYGGVTCTMKDSVTIAAVSNTLNVTEWQIKGPTVDKMLSATASIRFRHAFAGSANGVTSPAYTSTIYYR